ncbi:MAG: hypothetical protein ACJAWV_001947 [Flammeovirgaceae bacterium]|jgi:hypothetical protein
MKMAHLRIYDSHAEAHIVKGRLEGEGIHVFLMDENVSSQAIVPSIESMGIRLSVPMIHAEQALSVLKKIEEGKFKMDEIQKEK